VIEGEGAAATNFIVDHHDQRHTYPGPEGTLTVRGFSRMSGGWASLLSTRRSPAGAYVAEYRFAVSAVMEAELWVHEQGRLWSSPFCWRIDQGVWQRAGTELPMLNGAALSPDGPTFAWCLLGRVVLRPGEHRMLIKVAESRANGHFLLSQDCFMFVPGLPSAEVMAATAEGDGVLARLRCGSGEVLATQLLLGDRLSRSTPAYDPEAERFMLNLLSY
jgi:hypothetical protein